MSKTDKAMMASGVKTEIKAEDLNGQSPSQLQNGRLIGVMQGGRITMTSFDMSMNVRGT